MPGARCHAALLTAVLLLSTAGGQAHLEGQSALPVELNATTLVTALAHQSAVVLFHTRWCALCTAYAPEFRRVAAAYEKHTNGSEALLFGSVDVDAHREVAASFGVRSVPFVTHLARGAWFQHDGNGEPVALPAVRYDGPLAAGPTVEWVNNRTGLAVPWRAEVEELTAEGLEAVMAEAPGSHDVLVQFYGASCGRCVEFEPHYKQVGSHFRDVGHVRVARIDVHVHRHLVSAFNLSGIPSFVLFPRGRHRAGGLPFTSPRSSAALIQFVTSPAVATLEAEVKSKGGACMADLHARGVLHPPGGWPEDMALGQRAQGVVHAAHGKATGGEWQAALEILLCLAATPQLRNTGTGSAPAVWNLLDNAKVQVEQAALRRLGVDTEAGGMGAGEDTWPEAAPGPGLEAGLSVAGEHAAPEDDKWELFERLQAEHGNEL